MGTEALHLFVCTDAEAALPICTQHSTVVHVQFIED